MNGETFEFLEAELKNDTAVLRLRRPDKLNAMNNRMMAELEDGLLSAQDDDDIKVAVITGKGRAFSSGYDFGDGDTKRQSRTVEDWLSNSYSLIDVVYDLDVPVIAAVDGYALAGGCNLAAVADLTYATERSQFGYPDVHMGVIPPRFILPFVTTTPKHARELLYTGKLVDAAEAERLGIVNRVVENEELMNSVWEEVDHIRKTPTFTLELLKEAINVVEETQGYRTRGKLDEYLMGATTQSRAAREFNRICDEDGVDAAIEWMNNTYKD
jgi:enoyl-CoA hydratase